MNGVCVCQQPLGVAHNLWVFPRKHRLKRSGRGKAWHPPNHGGGISLLGFWACRSCVHLCAHVNGVNQQGLRAIARLWQHVRHAKRCAMIHDVPQFVVSGRLRRLEKNLHIHLPISPYLSDQIDVVWQLKQTQALRSVSWHRDSGVKSDSTWAQHSTA